MSVEIYELPESEQENCEPFECALVGQIHGERPVFVTLEISSADAKYASLSLSFKEPLLMPTFWQEISPEISDDEELSRELGGNAWEKVLPEAIWKKLNVFLGKEVNLTVEAMFSIERKEIPQDSLVSSMIGLRTVAGEEQFLLTGAQFAVRGFPDDTVSWYLKPGTSNRTVSGQLIRQRSEQFSAESLSDAIQILQTRFNQVIRAQSNLKTHAIA
ncbi:MAG TPA: hypothetical protein VGI40_10380 [Pirellulaceae bacterium]